MGTIPANYFAGVTPSVLSAGGNALDLIGVLLTTSARPPIGSVLSFPSAVSVGAYFGLGSDEYAESQVYFGGFDNSLAKPGSMLVTQYNTSRVGAWLRGGNASALLTTLQAVTSGALEVIVDGFSWKSTSINLSSDTTLSAVAATIQSDLALPGSGSITASLSPNPTWNSNPQLGQGPGTLIVTEVASGTVAVGQVVTGTDVDAGTYIVGYGTGSGGTGTYYVNISQTVASEAITLTGSTAAFTGAIAGNVLTVSVLGSGTIQPGMIVAGSSVAAETAIEAQLTGTIGGVGTYTIHPSQTVNSESMTAAPADITVAYDSLSGGFVISSGSLGTASTIQFATRSLATTMLLTEATGAVISQGAPFAVPGTFMTNLTLTTQNWTTFWLNFDPDGGTGNANKLLFSQWTSQQNNRYLFACWDTDITPTESVPATESLGYLLQQGNYSGTALNWTPGNVATQYYAAFVCGSIASIDFDQPNGRTTLAFKGQSGLVATVTSETVASNLAGTPQNAGNYGNGYNFYGAFATANQTFVNFQRGTVSGPFQWIDTYINQIWLNNALQLALVQLLTSVTSLPYNNAGYALFRAACLDPITAAVNFGAIVPGVQLTMAQIAEVNNLAGNTSAATIIQTQGWYLQILPATGQVRQGRTTPPATLWWCDGGSIQSINLASITVQ